MSPTATVHRVHSPNFAGSFPLLYQCLGLHVEILEGSVLDPFEQTCIQCLLPIWQNTVIRGHICKVKKKKLLSLGLISHPKDLQTHTHPST